MRHLHEFENRPIKLQNKILEKVLDIAQLTSEEKNEYEDSLKTYNDLKKNLDTAENKGYLKAEELFLPQIEEERKQQEEAIKNLYKAGIPIAVLATSFQKTETEILATLNR